MFASKYRTIGLKILYYRKLRGYTQMELANKVGISTTYLGQIERGNYGKSFSLEALLTIAHCLDVDIVDLVSDGNKI